MNIVISLIMKLLSVTSNMYGTFCACREIVKFVKQNIEKQTVSGTDDLSDEDE